MEAPVHVPFLDALQPALDRLAAAKNDHAHDWDTTGADAACVCGWTPKRPSAQLSRRKVGQHISAAHKRAEKVYDTEADQIIADRHQDRSRLP